MNFSEGRNDWGAIPFEQRKKEHDFGTRWFRRAVRLGVIKRVFPPPVGQEGKRRQVSAAAESGNWRPPSGGFVNSAALALF